MMENDDRPVNLTFVQVLAGKALLDEEFRSRFLENPESVAKQFGFFLTESQVEKIKSLDEAQVNAWVTEFEGYTGQTVMAMSAW